MASPKPFRDYSQYGNMADTTELLAVAISIVVGTPVGFFIKDFLVGRSNYKKFKATLEKTAGINAEILYSAACLTGPGATGPRLYKVAEINKQGLVLKDDMNTIFVPKEKILMTDIVLPTKDYDSLRKERMKKDSSEMIEAVFPPIMDKIKEVLVSELLTEDSEFSAVVGVRVVSQLREAGIDPEKFLEKKPTIKRILEEIEASEKKTEPSDTKEVQEKEKAS